MEGSGELRLLFSPVCPLLVMRLSVLMGALGGRGGAEQWRRYGSMASVRVFGAGGFHAWLPRLPRGADQRATRQRLTHDYITKLPKAAVPPPVHAAQRFGV